jgi:ferric-dicitrate binding protein FerR (iron transport regulator)
VAKTRSRKEVKNVQQRVRKHVRAYKRAQKALEQLGASKEEMNQYKPLLPQDLKMSQDIMEENRIGQKSDTLAWFWRMGEENPEQGNKWMTECKLGKLIS